jgi:prophage regulatory protein
MTLNLTESSPERLLRLPEVISQTGLNRNSIYQIEDFPRPIKIGARASAWVQSEIQLWIKSTVEKQR